MEETAAIRTRKLSKVFGTRKAVDKVSIEVPQGAFLSIFGPNGAGKTTLLRMLSTLTRPTDGSASLMGIDLREDPEAARGRIGLISHNAMLYPDLTAEQNLLLYAKLYGLADPQATDVLQLSGGLLWALIVFTSLLGLNRSFNHEKEQGCMEGILLVPMDRSVIFLAKATSNLLFLLVVEVIAVPLFWFFFLTTAQPGPGFMLMAVPLAVGTIGMAGIGTLLSTITVNTRGKDVMLAVLFVPLIFPLLYACASATTAVVVVAEGYLDVFAQSMALAGGYDVIMLLVSWVLYDFVISA